MKLFGRFFVAMALAFALALAPARATVSSTVNKTIALGNGTSTVFTFSFVGVAAAYISVIFTDASGNETVLSQGSGATQYQISLNAPVTGAIWGIGGTVTYNPSGTPIPSGSTLTIFRTLPLTQAISLQNQNSLSRLGNGAETGLDMTTMLVQQNAETLARAIVAPVVDATAPAPLPPIAQRANQGAAFDSQGNLVAGSTPASGVISSAMQPVVNAASLAAGRSAFGLGAMATEGIGCGLSDDGSGNARLNPAISQIAVNTAIHKANCFNSFITTGPITLTLDRGNTLFNGFGFWVYNTSAGAVTLAPNANDTFQGYASGQSVKIPANMAAFISTDGGTFANWLVQYSIATGAPVASGGFSNLTLTNTTNASANDHLDIHADEMTLPGPIAGGVRFTSIAFTINCATIGANGMDTGSLPTSGWVYIYAISDGASIAGLASTSSSSPTMPLGYIYKKRIGAMRTDSSAHFMRTLQKNSRTKYVVTAATNTVVPPAIVNQAGAIGNVNGTYVAFSVSSVVPPTASMISLQVMQLSSVGGSALIALVAPNNNYGGIGSTTNMPPITTVADISSSQQLNQGITAQMMLESTNIYVASSGGINLTIAAEGWIDNL
ncbi:hypothetical protein ACRQ5Q_22245 [Bradyrhizobium sp. PMVTL-01]|uniref:hypothetical protein n=1 Tax=Bradyrhizobium sp. PMVTL-01 TaxID=3434999 RepID=UPI003F703DBB